MVSPVRVSSDRRAGIRVEVNRQAVLRFGNIVEQVEIENLTRDGCKIRTEAEFPPSAEVSIGLAGIGHTPGRLVWRSASAYGCAFQRPLSAGAVTASELNNVAYFGNRPEAESQVAAPETKYSYRKRAGIIGGLTLGLWSAILGTVWLAVG